MLAVAAARLLQIAPFSSVNFVAGASRVTLRDFLLGTLLGTTPGVVLVAVLRERTEALLLRPGLANAALLALGLSAALLLFAVVRRLLRSGSGAAAPTSG